MRLGARSRPPYSPSVASCDAIPQAPTSFTPDAATVPCFIVGAAVGCLLLLSMLLTITTAAINNYTSNSKFLYTRHPPPPCSNSSVAPCSSTYTPYSRHRQNAPRCKTSSSSLPRIPMLGQDLPAIEGLGFHLVQHLHRRFPYSTPSSQSFALYSAQMRRWKEDIHKKR